MFQPVSHKCQCGCLLKLFINVALHIFALSGFTLLLCTTRVFLILNYSEFINVLHGISQPEQLPDIEMFQVFLYEFIYMHQKISLLCLFIDGQQPQNKFRTFVQAELVYIVVFIVTHLYYILYQLLEIFLFIDSRIETPLDYFIHLPEHKTLRLQVKTSVSQ